MPTDPTPPHGKAELLKALPPSVGHHDLLLREDHSLSSHLDYLNAHLDELIADHNLGTLGVERGPGLMLFLWAYRDAPQGSAEKETYRQQFLTHCIDGCNSKFQSLGIRQANLMLKAVDRGVNVVCFDSRHDYGKNAADFQKWQRTCEGLAFDTEADREAWIAMQTDAKMIYDNNPAYKQRMDAIHETILRLEANGTPPDVISAILFDSMANPSKNAVTTHGAYHVNGVYGSDGKGHQAQGIIDEALALRGWQVTDAIIGTESEVEKRIAEDLVLDKPKPEMAAFFPLVQNLGNSLPESQGFSSPDDQVTTWFHAFKPLLPEGPLSVRLPQAPARSPSQTASDFACKTFDQLDLIWSTDTDIVAHPTVKKQHGLDLPFGLKRDVCSCIDAPPAAQVFQPEKLNPDLVPEFHRLIVALREACNPVLTTIPVITATPQQTQRVSVER